MATKELVKAGSGIPPSSDPKILCDEGNRLYDMKEYEDAARLYRLAADQGYAVAQVKLGSMYELCPGVTQDYTEAVRLYRLAADQGYVDEQVYLGSMY